jgi:hypothetical protein
MFLKQSVGNSKNEKPFKVSFITLIMPKKDLNRVKAETASVKATITLEQKEAIKGLVGLIGSNEQDVVSKIITLWLYNEGFLNKNKDGSKKK